MEGGGGGGCPPCRGTPDRVEQWLSGKETPELLRGLVMGETLGVGSFGEVRVGTLPSGEHCAVKVMDPRKLSGTSLSEMRNEVNALAKLRHPHVIRYYGMTEGGSCTSRWCNDEYCGCLEFDADDDGCCSKCGHTELCHAASPEQRDTVAIVQELAAGGDLVSLLFTSSLGYRMDDIIPRSYFHQLLEGIAYCHSQKVCHGDIKPENLCLNSSAKLKIVDFGLCHELGSSTRGGAGGSGLGGSGWSSGGSGSHIHSGCYTAPEIHAKDQEFDREAADVWSCGVVLYMMTAREVPFEYSDGAGPAAIQDGTFPWPSSMDSELRNLITVMLDPRPSSRWTIDQIRRHPWYERPVMTQKELTLHMADHMQSAWAEQKKHELVKLLQSPQPPARPAAPRPTEGEEPGRAAPSSEALRQLELGAAHASPVQPALPRASLSGPAGLGGLTLQSPRTDDPATEPAAQDEGGGAAADTASVDSAAASAGPAAGEEAAPALRPASAPANPSTATDMVGAGAPTEPTDSPGISTTTSMDEATQPPELPAAGSDAASLSPRDPHTSFRQAAQPFDDSNSDSDADGEEASLDLQLEMSLGASRPAPMSEAAAAAGEGMEPESDAMDPGAPGKASAPEPRPSSGGERERPAGAVTLSGPPLAAEDGASSSRNSKRTHSKTRPIGDAGEDAAASGRESARAKRTHSQTRMPPHERAARQGRAAGQAGHGDSSADRRQRAGSEEPDESRYKGRKKLANEARSSGTSEPAAAFGEIGADALDREMSSGSATGEHRLKRTTRAHMSSKPDVLDETGPTSASFAPASAAAASTPRPEFKAGEQKDEASAAAAKPPRSHGAAGRTTPTGVAVHTYINIPGGTKKQAVDVLTSALRNMSIHANVSMTTAGDVIIRHSSANTDRETSPLVESGGAAMRSLGGRSPMRVAPGTPDSPGSASNSDAEAGDTSRGGTPVPQALMKAQVYERPAAAGGGAVIGVQRLRGPLLPHLQQFARIKEQVERTVAAGTPDKPDKAESGDKPDEAEDDEAGESEPAAESDEEGEDGERTRVTTPPPPTSAAPDPATAKATAAAPAPSPAPASPAVAAAPAAAKSSPLRRFKSEPDSRRAAADPSQSQEREMSLEGAAAALEAAAKSDGTAAAASRREGGGGRRRRGKAAQLFAMPSDAAAAERRELPRGTMGDAMPSADVDMGERGTKERRASVGSKDEDLAPLRDGGEAGGAAAVDAGAEGESEPAAMDDLEALVGDKRTVAEVGLLDRRRRAGSEEPAEDRHVRARLSVDSSKG